MFRNFVQCISCQTNQYWFIECTYQASASLSLSTMNGIYMCNDQIKVVRFLDGQSRGLAFVLFSNPNLNRQLFEEIMTGTLKYINLSSKIFFGNLITRFCSNKVSKTCLYDFHLRHGARMIDFAGYLMPLQYKSHSIIDSHKWVREKCGLFDVSHMLQFKIHGENRKKFIHSITVIDMDDLEPDYGSLSLFTNENGGIMDDVIINNTCGTYYYGVSNAGCATKIKNHLLAWEEKFQKQNKNIQVEWVEKGLIALQGPKVADVLQPGLDKSLKDLYFGRGMYCSVFGIPNCRVTRCGYTGEDGVEISVSKAAAEELAEKLLSNENVIPVGLGARDTLRLEAGLCLYGNDIDEHTTPGEASLSWTIKKNRKTVIGNDFVKFPGFDKIMSQINKESPITKRRVGLISTTGPPPRSGSEILSVNNEVVGQVTSGCFSPTLNINICMGYIESKYIKDETQIQFRIRGKVYPGHVKKLPFVKNNYYSNRF